jgi:hypothetical protein
MLAGMSKIAATSDRALGTGVFGERNVMGCQPDNE